MSMRGSLETFSLPELFQIIGLGNKSGRLSFSPKPENNDIQLNTTFELWFERGNFVAIVNTLKYQGLIEMIQENVWVESRTLVKSKYLCPPNKSFGNYLKEQKLLDISQINSLYVQQLNKTKKLFNVKSARFKFEEINDKNKIASDGETFPWTEMTGISKQAVELSLEAMRDFSNWSRFAEEIPPAYMGLKKLVPSCDIELIHMEQHLWDMADGLISLQKIAEKREFDLLTVQRTALSMIFAGIVEEVPVISTKKISSSMPKRKQLNHREANNLAVTTETKAKISRSLINNLVSFLKENF